MRYSILVVAVAACALAACEKKTASSTITTNAQTGEVTTTGTTPSAASLGLKPGKWEVKVAVTDLKMTNMPAGVNTAPPPVTTSICMTPEQAAKGPGDLLKQAKADCTVTSSSYTGGKVQSDATCKVPGGGTMHVASTGTYTPTTLTTDASIEMTGAMKMSQKTHTEAKRVGDCAAAG